MKKNKKMRRACGHYTVIFSFRLVREQGCPISHAHALHLDYYCTSAERILESESMYYKGHIPGLIMYKHTKKNTFRNVTWNVPPQEWGGGASKFNIGVAQEVIQQHKGQH